MKDLWDEWRTKYGTDGDIRIGATKSKINILLE